jgi:hypothetical protein
MTVNVAEPCFHFFSLCFKMKQALARKMKGCARSSEKEAPRKEKIKTMKKQKILVREKINAPPRFRFVPAALVVLAASFGIWAVFHTQDEPDCEDKLFHRLNKPAPTFLRDSPSRAGFLRFGAWRICSAFFVCLTRQNVELKW